MKSLRCNALKLLMLAVLVAVCLMLWRAGVQMEELTGELKRMNDIAERAMRMVE